MNDALVQVAVYFEGKTKEVEGPCGGADGQLFLSELRVDFRLSKLLGALKSGEIRLRDRGDALVRQTENALFSGLGLSLDLDQMSSAPMVAVLLDVTCRRPSGNASGT